MYGDTSSFSKVELNAQKTVWTKHKSAVKERINALTFLLSEAFLWSKV